MSVLNRVVGTYKSMTRKDFFPPLVRGERELWPVRYFSASRHKGKQCSVQKLGRTLFQCFPLHRNTPHKISVKKEKRLKKRLNSETLLVRSLVASRDSLCLTPFGTSAIHLYFFLFSGFI